MPNDSNSGQARARASLDGEPRTPFGKIVALVALLYPLGLLFTIVVFRYIGERYWLVSGIEYLPRFPFGLPLPIIALVLALRREWRLLALQSVSFLLWLVPLMGFVVRLPLPAAQGKTLRLMTCNVNSGLGGVDQLEALVSRYSPDVVVMQELGPSGTALSERLSRSYPAVKVSTQFLIASKHPILSTTEPARLPLYGYMRSPRFIEHVLDTPLGKIALYNVHPISPREGLNAVRGQGLRREILSGRLFAGANAPILRANNLLRSMQMDAIAAAASRETNPVVIAGDTNLPGLSAILRRDLSDFRDGFSSAGFGFGYTFPTTKRFGPWMRIDRILTSSTLRFVSFEVVNSTISDHRPVVADVTLDR